MKLINQLFPVALVAVLLPAMTLAATPAHDIHHGATVPSTAAASAELSTDTAAPADDPAADLLKRMQAVHERLPGARNAGERRKVLAESRQLLLEAMALLDAAEEKHHRMMGKAAGNNDEMDMDHMGGLDTKQCMEMHAARARHMDLMHAVLRALVDQQAAAIPAG